MHAVACGSTYPPLLLKVVGQALPATKVQLEAQAERFQVGLSVRGAGRGWEAMLPLLLLMQLPRWPLLLLSLLLLLLPLLLLLLPVWSVPVPAALAVHCLVRKRICALVVLPVDMAVPHPSQFPLKPLRAGEEGVQVGVVYPHPTLYLADDQIRVPQNLQRPQP